MSGENNTLFLRLAGPMQSWGTSSRFQLRRTDSYPSKSGVLGMLLCASGVCREDSKKALEPLAALHMGVRIDLCGTLDWDYHTAGAGIGVRSADGKIKITQATGEKETLLSRRQYLYDASFLVALQGDSDIIETCANALNNPVWPLFLGRKCCIPSEPVFAGAGSFATLADALSSPSRPWQPRINAIDHEFGGKTKTLKIYVEHPPGLPPPVGARLVHDVPIIFGFYSYSARWVVKEQVTVPVGMATQRAQTFEHRGDPYSEHFKKVARPSRLKLDKHLCVVCKSPAEEVHHVDYTNVGRETDDDLRSLCKICHEACTMLEYSDDMRRHRIDPLDAEQLPKIQYQIKRILDAGRPDRRRELLKTARQYAKDSNLAHGIARRKED